MNCLIVVLGKEDFWWGDFLLLLTQTDLTTISIPQFLIAFKQFEQIKQLNLLSNKRPVLLFCLVFVKRSFTCFKLVLKFLIDVNPGSTPNSGFENLFTGIDV